MKLSDETVSVLKNYSTINQNLMIKSGQALTTMSAMKNIVAKSTVAENFERDIAIYDLNEFLSILSTYDDVDIEFCESFLILREGNKNTSYPYSDPSVVTSVTKDITMPECEVKFSLSTDILSSIQKMSAITGAPDMVLEKGELKVTDKKNDNAVTHTECLFKDDKDDVDYKFWFKVENLKLLPGTYDVSVSSKRISHFKNTNVDIEYFIALEPESYFKSDS